MDKEQLEALKSYINRNLPRTTAIVITGFIEEQQKEIFELKDANLYFRKLRDDTIDSLVYALSLRDKEIARLREALEFYANGEHWKTNVFGYDYVVEKGEIARQALKIDEQGE